MSANQNDRRTSVWRHLTGLSIAHVLADGYGMFAAPLLYQLEISLGVPYAAVSALLGLTGLPAAAGNVLLGLGIDRWKRAGVATISRSPT